MTTTRAPGNGIQFSSIGVDDKIRHELLVDLFGQYVFWLRNWANRRTRRLIETSEARERLGTIHRRPFEAVSGKPSEQRESAILLAEANLDSFIQRLLSVLGHQGFDFVLGDKHVLRFRVIMEVVDQDSEEVVHEEVINRYGEKHFTDYWGRWLNSPWANET